MARFFDRMNVTRRASGFTLLEVMIAVSILSVGFFAVYSLFLQSVAASDEARFKQQAAFLATLKESAWVKDSAELSRDEGNFGEEYPGWRWRVTPTKVEHKEFEEVAKRLQRVRLEVFQEGDDQVYGLTHYIFVTEVE